MSASGPKLRIAVLGAGALGQRWAETLASLPGVSLAGFVDPIFGEDRRPEWLRAYSGIPAASSLTELPDQRIDAALVAAFSPAHADAVQTALDHDLHVFVEKPFTVDLASADSLVRTASERKRIIMVNQNYRFFPGPRLVSELWQKRAYGDIRSAVCQFWCNWPGKPYQHRMEHPMGLEMAVHHFDLARFMFAAEPVSGLAVEWNPAQSPYQSAGALEATFILRNVAGEFPFNYSGSLVSSTAQVPWAGYWRFEFDRGTIFADESLGGYYLWLSRGGKRTRLREFGDTTMGFTASFTHFLECIQTGEQPSSSGQDNLNTLRMALSFLSPFNR